MPTKTFFNLPEEKRARLIGAAEAEFVRMPYGEVSINRIIRTAGIPRGSFYQYFTDKMDLFRFILHRKSEQINGVILEALDDCGGRLPEFPMTLLQKLRDMAQSNGAEMRMFMDIFRQNSGMDINHIWDYSGLVSTIVDRTDWSYLNIPERESQSALIDLLLASSGQAIAAILCGKQTPQESRNRLNCKTALILRGLVKDVDIT